MLREEKQHGLDVTDQTAPPAAVLIPVEQAVVGERRRRLSNSNLKALAVSMDEVGMLDPISVVAIDNEYRLIAGQHRLAAAKHLGWHGILAIILDLDDLDRQLATLDENLAGMCSAR